jgi:aryl-alcohol dehydrogenase-like predicted oxidoreductase
VQTNPANVVTLAPEVKGAPVERREEKLGREFEEPVSAQQAIESLRLTSRRTQVDFDIELNTIFLQIIDTRTEEVVDTIPPEELVRELRAKLKPSDQTPLDETVGAFGKLVDDGVVGIPGISNVALWRVVEARETAHRLGVAPYGAVQQCYSYLYPAPQPIRTNWASPELLDYARSTGVDGRPGLAVTAYSPLHQGAFTRDDKPLYDGADNPASRERIRVLRETAGELGVTPNQLALAWLLGGEVPVVPVVGASSVEQLEEILGAADLDLDEEVRNALDAA